MFSSLLFFRTKWVREVEGRTSQAPHQQSFWPI
jgi:hypothetical protein